MAGQHADKNTVYQWNTDPIYININNKGDNGLGEEKAETSQVNNDIKCLQAIIMTKVK